MGPFLTLMGTAGPPWSVIKAEYLQGVPPKDLASKYGSTAKYIGEKASREGWTVEKANIYKNIEAEIAEQKTKLVQMGGEALLMVGEVVMNELRSGVRGTNTQDGEGFPDQYVLSAWKKLLDVYHSATKVEQVQLTGSGDTPPVKVEFVRPDKSVTIE